MSDAGVPKRNGPLSAGGRGFRQGRFSPLAVKELREVLRDRRTIVTLFLMPALVYPLLSIGFQQFLLTGVSPNPEQFVYRLAVTSEGEAMRLTGMLRAGDEILRLTKAVDETTNPPARNQLRVPAPSLDNVRIVWFEAAPLESYVRSGEVDLGVRVGVRPRADGEPTAREGIPQREGELDTYDIDLIFRPSLDHAHELLTYVERRLNAVREQWMLARLARRGDQRPTPLALRYRELPSEQRDPFSLAALVPLVLVLMTITGAVYPAIDVTAGERERGTLESLMAAPVSRMRLLAAKYVAVMLVAVLTAMANIFAMIGTLKISGLGRALLGDVGFSATTLAKVFLLLILFAAFFAAVLLSLTSLARSFKEAQAYLIPLMLVALGPGFLSLMPDVRLHLGWAVTPLANLVLLARDILQGTADRSMALVAIVTTFLYGAGAVSLAARVFGSNAILYGAAGSWTDIWRRSREEKPVPTFDAAAVTVAILFPLYFMAGGLLGLLRGASIGQIEIFRAISLVVLFMLIPGFVAWRQRVSWHAAFQFRGAGWMAFAGAVVLGLSLWPFAHELFLLGRKLGIDPLNARLVENVNRLIEEWRRLHPVVILLTMAVAPAVCEELFFRGFLLSALRGQVPAWVAVGLSGVIFGLFHTFVGSTLTLERLLPSTMLGLTMATVCWRTRSVLPGMVLHGLNNGLVLMLVYYRDELTAQVFGAAQSDHLPTAWLAGAALAVMVGGCLIARSQKCAH